MPLPGRMLWRSQAVPVLPGLLEGTLVHECGLVMAVVQKKGREVAGV